MTAHFANDESCTEARATHDTLYQHDHKMQFHGDKWPKTEHMQITSNDASPVPPRREPHFF